MVNASIEQSKCLRQPIQIKAGLESRLFYLPAFQKGFSWVVLSDAHPEGKVEIHINEVMGNIEQLPNLDKKTYERLRVAALSHDTFKYLVNEPEYKQLNLHHGCIARKFMKQYTSDEVLLDLIEFHDEVYYAWLEGGTKAEERLNIYIDRFREHIRLHYLFFRCDTMTGNKTQVPRHWFEAKIKCLGDPHLSQLIDNLNDCHSFSNKGPFFQKNYCRKPQYLLLVHLYRWEEYGLINGLCNSSTASR